MVRNRFAWFAAFAAAASLCSAATAPAKKTRAAGGLEPLVRRLDGKLGRLVDPGALLEDKAFVQVFESPVPVRDEALALLARAEAASEDEKAMIDETLSGQAAAEVRELREDGQLGKKAAPPKK